MLAALVLESLPAQSRCDEGTQGRRDYDGEQATRRENLAPRG